MLSGNALAGVWISGQGTDDNVVAGNFIGTDAAGTAPLPNAKDGVDLEAGSCQREHDRRPAAVPPAT